MSDDPFMAAIGLFIYTSALTLEEIQRHSFQIKVEKLNNELRHKSLIFSAAFLV